MIDDLVIMIVEDNELDMLVVTNALENAGIRYVSVSDSTEALTVAKVVLPDIAILDINMPKLDGIQVCQQLKEHELTKDIKIVFLTATSSEDDVLFGVKAQIEHCITKGVPVVDLIKAIAGLDLSDKVEASLEKFNTYNSHIFSKYSGRVH